MACYVRHGSCCTGRVERAASEGAGLVLWISHHSSNDPGVGVENRKFVYAAEGEILAMRPLLTHASGLSKPGTTQHRRILHLEFAAGPLPKPLQWYEFHRIGDAGLFEVESLPGIRETQL